MTLTVLLGIANYLRLRPVMRVEFRVDGSNLRVEVGNKSGRNIIPREARLVSRAGRSLRSDDRWSAHSSNPVPNGELTYFGWTLAAIRRTFSGDRDLTFEFQEMAGDVVVRKRVPDEVLRSEE